MRETLFIALSIMGKGMLGIFIVIGLISILVAIMGKTGQKK